MKKNFKNNAQGGFTLIELIVVIVILGILAATAVPKFNSMSAEARIASLNAAKGALNSAATMSYAKTLASTGTGTYPLPSVLATLVDFSTGDYDLPVSDDTLGTLTVTIRTDCAVIYNQSKGAAALGTTSGC